MEDRLIDFEKESDYDSICSICLIDIDTNSIVTSCGHIYHKKCFNRWMKRRRTCPICRKNIPLGWWELQRKRLVLTGFISPIATLGVSLVHESIVPAGMLLYFCYGIVNAHYIKYEN
jgi:hypothetical protein